MSRLILYNDITGICPTTISSSESVLRLSSESVGVAVGIEFQNPFPQDISGNTHKNAQKKQPKPKEKPTKPTGKLGIIVRQIPNSGVGQIPNSGVGQIPNSGVGQIQLSLLILVRIVLSVIISKLAFQLQESSVGQQTDSTAPGSIKSEYHNTSRNTNFGAEYLKLAIETSSSLLA